MALRPPLAKGLPFSAPRYAVVREALPAGGVAKDRTPILGLPLLPTAWRSRALQPDSRMDLWLAATPADTDYVNQRRPPKQLRARLTRQHLLDAARRVFGESGYAAATVDDVARAAGCSKGAYYFHFTTKEEALLAAAEDWSTGQTRRLEVALEGGRTPDAALSSALAALFDAEAYTSSDRLLVLELWLQAARNPAVRAVLDAARGSWRRVLTVAFARAQVGAPKAAADLALAFHDGLLARACLDGTDSATSDERVASALALLAAPRTLRRTA